VGETRTEIQDQILCKDLTTHQEEQTHTMKSLTLWVVGFKDAATSSVGGAVVEEATGFSSSSCKSELLVLACCCCCSWVLGDCCAQLD
jgi:hypothetical protein